MDEGSFPDDEPTAGELAREEREAMYPMSGYVLVAVDYTEPPGEGLTKLGLYSSLAGIEFPETTAAGTSYVVYDAEGTAYRRREVERERGDRPADDDQPSETSR